jgi:5-methylcytosine-specific restriction protein A
MTKSPRPFRTPESLQSEAMRRGAIQPLLDHHGFQGIVDRRDVRGTSTSQIISGRDPAGQPFKARVRLCWRRDGRNTRERDYAAAQLRASLIDGDGDGERTVRHIVERELELGHTHNLLVQYDGDEVVFAVMTPSSDLAAIWSAQRAKSDELIRAGLTGAIAKNHASNGHSPTLWLQDDRTAHTHAVADVLWTWPGVVNVLAYPTSDGGVSVTDTFDDLPFLTEDAGRDLGLRITQVRSGFARDPKVRRLVLERADGRCEQEGCGESRCYAGFLDVHHILGVWASDRVWSCVALCPNCHREAHLSPDREALNSALEAYAAQFRSER